MGNNAHASELAAALPEKNVMFAFALSAGHWEYDRVVSIDLKKITIGQLRDSTSNERLIGQIFDGTKFSDMDFESAGHRKTCLRFFKLMCATSLGKLCASDHAMNALVALKAANRNPYSWNMDFYEYPDGSGLEVRFFRCRICTLMNELGLYDLTPAMSRLDYTMSEAGGVSDFVREYSLTSGGPLKSSLCQGQF